MILPHPAHDDCQPKDGPSNTGSPATQPASGDPQTAHGVLVVSKPGHVCDALVGLLKTLSGLGAVTTVESGLLALSAAETAHPKLVVLVAGGLPAAEPPELVRQLRQRMPNTPCVVLAENKQQLEHALQAGATLSFPARTPSGQLLSAIQNLLKLLSQSSSTI